ncbi:hypothetical protein [Streptomyces sp. NPDC047070]|uniref:hypothetical protein n=1 Tax=Streptomyces sp. NPDC047070 TaxID=3154923 RepID=UPI003454551C
MFMTYQAQAPAILGARCVPCRLEGVDTLAEFLVSATSGYGLAACAEHREVTIDVLSSLDLDDDRALRTLFALAGQRPPQT